MKRKRLQPSLPPSLVCLCVCSVHGVYVMHTSDVFFTGMDGWMDSCRVQQNIYKLFPKGIKIKSIKEKAVEFSSAPGYKYPFFFFPDHCNISVLLKSGCAGLLYLDSSLCRFLQQQFFCNFS